MSRARLLAETGDRMYQTGPLDEAKRLVRKADRKDRWRVLAEIAVTEAQAGWPSATETFAAARDLLLADFDDSDATSGNCAACSC